MLAAALGRDHDTFEGVVRPDDREPIENFWPAKAIRLNSRTT
jgi:hypothetical protein